MHETKTARDRYHFPSNLIAIGYNGGGDTLVYKIKEDGQVDSIVYWFDHETEALNFAAADFSEFNNFE